MSEQGKPRTTTAIRFPADVHEALADAAQRHGLSMNWLVVQAVREFLPAMVEPSEVRLTRTDPGSRHHPSVCPAPPGSHFPPLNEAGKKKRTPWLWRWARPIPQRPREAQ